MFFLPASVAVGTHQKLPMESKASTPGVTFSIIVSKTAMKEAIRCAVFVASSIFHVLTAEDISHVSLMIC